MSDSTTTRRANKVSVFASKVMKNEAGEKMNTVDATIRWNDSEGNPHITESVFSVENDELTMSGVETSLVVEDVDAMDEVVAALDEFEAVRGKRGSNAALDNLIAVIRSAQ